MVIHGHNGEPIGNHHRSFEWCHRCPLRPPLPPKMGVPYAPKIREWPYLCNGWSDPLHVWFYGRVFGDGRSNGAIFDSNKFKMAAAAILDNFEWPYLLNGSRSTYRASRGHLCDSTAFLFQILSHYDVLIIAFTDFWTRITEIMASWNQTAILTFHLYY